MIITSQHYYPRKPPRRKPRLNPTLRLLTQIEFTDDCWVFRGTRLPGGYGRIGFYGKYLLVHRLIYELFNGPIAEGLDVCHRCDNPPCCNPDHLFLGTAKENMADARAKGRTSLGRPHKPTGGLSDRELRRRATFRRSRRRQSEVVRYFGISHADFRALPLAVRHEMKAQWEEGHNRSQANVEKTNF